jgi:hypothetical protein
MPVRGSMLDGGVLEYILGNTTAPPPPDPDPDPTPTPIDRSLLVSGTYNPVYYSGTPKMGGNYLTNRCGYLGPDFIQQELEGTSGITYSTNGQVINSTAFYRRVSVTGQNITFNNCIFYGTPTDATTPVTLGSAQVNTTFNDCTFAPLAPQWATSCARIGLGGGTFFRCDFYGGTDGVANNSGTGWPQQYTFKQCAFHDMVYMSPDPDAAGGLPDSASHTDVGAQWGGGRLKFDGCGIWGFYDMTPHRYQAAEPNTAFGSGSTTGSSDPFDFHFTGNKYTDTVARTGDARTPAARVGSPSVYATSCVMFSPMYRNVDYFEMTNCYLDGSSWALNIGNTTGTNTTFTDFRFTNNKIGTNHRWTVGGTNKVFTWAGSNESRMLAVATISGNTDLATGAALTYADLS